MKNILLKTSIFIVTLLCFLLISSKNVLAVTVAVTSSPTSIGNEEFNVGVSVTGADDGTNYLRIDLYKDGTSNYFGETYNGSSWNSGSSGTSYAPITIASSSGTAIIKGKLGNPTSGEYPGPGSYKLKVRRYTSDSSYSFSNSVDIQINHTFATSTPTPTSAPTNTPTATPKPTPTKTPTPKPTVKPTATPEETEEPTSTPEVLGDTTFGESTPIPTPIVEGTQVKNFPFIAVGMIVLGIVFIGIPIVWFWRQKAVYNGSNEESSD